MGLRVRCITLLAVLMGFSAGSMIAQEQFPVAPLDPPDEIPAAISFFAPFFFPKIVQDEYGLKEYIKGEEFARFRQTYGDRQAVDAIFNRALHLCWNNTGEALLVCLFATMDHRSFGVRLPLVGAILWIPLTYEFPDEFAERTRALPRRLYADTPADSTGDRDKLQHFFGSAFLTVLTESPGAARRSGEFVEWGESLFIVGGVDDERDLRADRQGANFGMWLLSDIERRPSRFLVP